MQGMTDPATERNVLDGPLEPCGGDPITGFYRDGRCSCGEEDLGLHAVCAVVTAEFLEHQRAIGNDLTTPVPEYAFPGLRPGDRWCVVAVRWLQAYQDGVAAPVVLASTNARALEVIPLSVLREHSVDVPPDASDLD
jgi:uncharacterized protein (DUF2237 family)